MIEWYENHGRYTLQTQWRSFVGEHLKLPLTEVLASLRDCYSILNGMMDELCHLSVNTMGGKRTNSAWLLRDYSHWWYNIDSKVWYIEQPKWWMEWVDWPMNAIGFVVPCSIEYPHRRSHQILAKPLNLEKIWSTRPEEHQTWEYQLFWNRLQEPNHNSGM